MSKLYPVKARLDNVFVEQNGSNCVVLKTAEIQETGTDLIPSISTGTPVNAVAAVGTITSDNTAPANGGTIVIGSQTWTVAASRTGAFTVAAGSDGDTFLANLRTAINTDSTLVTAGAVNTGSHTLPVTWATKGTAGNAVTFTETCTHITIDGSGHLGGTTAGVAGTVGVKNAIKIDGTYLWFCTDTNTATDANWKKLTWA